MIKSLSLALILLATISVATGCNRKAPEGRQRMASEPAEQKPTLSAFTGNVVETMNADRYTYVHVERDDQRIWAAATAFDVKVGQTVTVPTTMPMMNFTSDSLKRTFDVVYFASAITVHGSHPNGAVQMPPNHPPMMSGPNAKGHPVASAIPADETKAIDFSGIAKPEGGWTVAEVYAHASNLAGSNVVTRGKVVKVNTQIMGKNWIHVRDGSGTQGSNDLTVVTLDTATVGDTVVVSGVLATNRDYGLGYKYPILLDEAKVKTE